MPLENATLPNITVPPLEITSPTGMLTLLVGLVFLVVAIFVVFKLLKNVIANAIIGGIGLIVLHFVLPFLFKVEVPITLLNIVICIIAGLPGLVVVVLMSLFGIH